MLAVFDPIRNMSLAAVFVRMLLAVFCGSLIGIEREFKRRPAGFRTHILVCLGAAITTLTSQYLLQMQYYTDVARLGAQVVAGIGFIGAGTIIVSRRQRVKGLTTAAGLWTTAIVGLALGGGFYEGGLFAAGLILLAELAFSKIEYRILNHSSEVNLYLEYADRTCLENVLKFFRERNIRVLNLEIARTECEENQGASAIFALRLNKKIQLEQVLMGLMSIDGLSVVEEL